ncbi:prepilin-type N-terminal cleavage/methylation domain-containing protein [Opitutus sp. GAS368]|jgi:Tfp pilus assembly protein PilW|uniref:PulJ/GspJ family protein n=1 Tax=Opitutus sp. GAS368 TaxID=1882749 RepID=UPI00087BFF55|nr:prepilin-type N-terminal cleavage/methylation domain-containing protein [Opitutus sp. GAS368]SDS66371.1 Type IV pilin N-term methylation site GFxxxE [Opitutus sp. GAS368]
MTISTPRTDSRPAGLATPKRAPRAREGGFTLVEVLIAATLSTLVLAGVLSAFLFLARTSFRSSGYSEMEAEVRRGLDIFARDTRNATDVHWNSAQSITLTVGGLPVTYAYDSDPASGTYGSFYRLADSTGQSRTVLVHSVAPDFVFNRYKLEQPGVSDNTAGNDSETKLLQLTLRAVRTNVATTGASNAATSARFMLRNKRVAN